MHTFSDVFIEIGDPLVYPFRTTTPISLRTKIMLPNVSHEPPPLIKEREDLALARERKMCEA